MRNLVVVLGVICQLTATAIAASPRLDCRVSWIGNTFPGVPQWVQQDIEAICVAPDGTVFTNAVWEEGGGNCGQYKDGDVLGFARHTHGWGAGGGRAVAANSKYVFIAVQMGNEGGGLKDPGTWPPKGFQWGGISRRSRADFSKAASFDGGKGGKGDTLRQCFLPVIEAHDNREPQGNGRLSGLAADETRLYASDPHAGKIHVYDAESMREISTFAFDRPGPLALDPQGHLWVLDLGDKQRRPRIVQLNADGGASDSRAAFSGDPNARLTTFCFGPAGELYALDDSERQQILRVDHPGEPSMKVTRLGAPGGILSGADAPAGSFGDWRLNAPSSVGVDAAGNIYVAHHGSAAGGSTVLESYTPDGKSRWRLLGLCFIDLADVDPQEDSAVFTKEERFSLDFSRPAGHEWTYRAYTLDRYRFPDDPRLRMETAGAWVRRLGGERILFVNDMVGARLQVFRFDARGSGEIAIPSGLFVKNHCANPKHPGWPAGQPVKGEWIWRDANGDGRFQTEEYQSRGGEDAPRAQGWWVDDLCGVWQATERSGIRYWPCLGRDGQGNPQWSYDRMKILPHANEFDQIKRVRYEPSADTLYLAGTKGDDKNQHWKPSGPVIARYDGCLRGESRVRWQIVAPYARGSHGHESCEPMGFDVAGEYVFVPYTGASNEIGFKTGHVEVLRADDGASIGHFEPSPEIGEIGLQDIQECLRAVRRKDGEYLIFLEDDFKAKNVLFRWRPRAVGRDPQRTVDDDGAAVK